MRTWAYVLVRVDMPLAHQIVHVGHACMEAARHFPYDDGTHLVILEVAHRSALEDALFDLRWDGIRYHAFHEPDDNLGLTAVCTERISAPQRRCFRRFAMWRAPAQERAPPVVRPG